MIFNKYFKSKNVSSTEKEKNKIDSQNIKEKQIKVINKNGVETFEKQFQKRTLKGSVLIPIHETAPSIYHYWYDCYEDWSDEYLKNFQGWKLQHLEQLTDCRECKRCMERDYRNAHPNTSITGYEFHYYYEDL